MGGSSRPSLRVARGALDEGLQEAALAPLRRSSSGSITAILEWLHYADLRLAPLRRSRNGSIGAVADTADCEKPMQPATGHASIRHDSDLVRMSVSAPDAREPFPNVNDCTLRYSGGSTYLPDENPNDETNTALGYIDAAEARAALAPLDRRKRYKHVLMKCAGAESLNSDRIRFLLLAGDSLVEIGYAGTPGQRQLAVRHYRRAR